LSDDNTSYLLTKERSEDIFDDSKSIADIDIVISGGGLKGYFMVGATFILAKEMKKRNLRYLTQK
jgi:hypothetical protein